MISDALGVHRSYAKLKTMTHALSESKFHVGASGVFLSPCDAHVRDKNENVLKSHLFGSEHARFYIEATCAFLHRSSPFTRVGCYKKTPSVGQTAHDI